jgi:ribosomal protein S18 acetylase RimI-like enzyme
VGETVVIRQAEHTDVAAAAAVWHAAHLARRNGRELPQEQQSRVLGRMTAPDALLVVAEDLSGGESAEDDGQPRVVGSILGAQGREDDGAGPPVPGLLHISAVSVTPDRWGEHVGRLLMWALFDLAAARGYRRAQLWAHGDNLRANRLYRGLGFRRTGRARIDDWGELVVHYQRVVEESGTAER